MTDDNYAVTTTPDRCPECGFVIECCWGSSAGSEMAAPSPGDWSICAGCAAPLRFNNELRLRATTIEERSGPEAPAELMLMVKAMATIGPPKAEATTLANAHLLITSVSEAIANGVVHRDRSGKVLTTPKEVLACLLSEGGVECEETKR